MIRAELDREPVASGYGALAAGGDVLIAEALLVGAPDTETFSQLDPRGRSIS